MELKRTVMILDNEIQRSPHNNHPDLIYGECKNCKEKAFIHQLGSLMICEKCYPLLDQLQENLKMLNGILREKGIKFTDKNSYIEGLVTLEAKNELGILLEDYPRFKNYIKFTCINCKSELDYDHEHMICLTCGDIL